MKERDDLSRLAEARKEGTISTRRDIARNMKAAGMDSGEIVKLTGITAEELDTL